MQRALLVNPPIYDFAAYDLWARPLGLLYVAAALERQGREVRIIDCLDRFHPSIRDVGGKHGPRSRNYGTGSYYWREAEKPAVYDYVPRVYKRFGLPEEILRREIAAGPKPDFIGITSGMTYWYLGVAEAVRICREVWPGVEIVLGGIYATLCAGHAERVVKPDTIVRGGGMDRSPTGQGRGPGVANSLPAYHLLSHLPATAILTGSGCPFACAYCASKILAPKLERRPVQQVADEIELYRRRFNIADIAFYDDALLWDTEDHIKPILREVISRNLGARFHTPNGLHARMIDAELARLMREAGFVTIRLSLETVSREGQASWDHKVRYDEFLAAVAYLKSAGFSAENLGAYVMAGTPDESPSDPLSAIAAAHAAGVGVRLAEYSPIPGTADFERARAAAAVDITEPLLQNNTVAPIGGLEGFKRHQVLKSVVQKLNDALLSGQVLVTPKEAIEDGVKALERAGVM